MNSTLKLTLASLATFCISLISLGQAPSDSALISVISSRATSEKGTATVSKTYDGQRHTQWESIPDFPSNFFERADRNLLLGIPTKQLNSSAAKGLRQAAIDGNLKSGIEIRAGHWYTIDLATPRYIHLMALKASVKTTISIYGFNNKDSVKIGEYHRADHYSVKKIQVDKSFSKIKLFCQNPFLLFEIGASSEAATEELYYDFGKPFTLKSVELEFKGCTTADSVHIDLSDDGQTWVTTAKANPREYFPKTYPLTATSQSQYARIRFFIKKGNYMHGKLTEASFFGKEHVKGKGPATKNPLQWDPMAGLWPAFTDDAFIEASSSNSKTSMEMLKDNDESTGWSATASFPSHFMTRADRNIFLTPQNISSTTTSGANPLSYCIDGNLGTADQINSNSGNSWLKINFKNPQKLHLISLKASNKNAPISIMGYLQNGDSTNLGTYTTKDHYGVRRFAVNNKITRLELKSTSSFQLFEISGLENPMYEDIMVDLKSARDIGWVSTCFRNSQWIDSVHFDVSNDKVRWSTVARPNNNAYFESALSTYPVTKARYARLRIFVAEKDYARAELYEFSIRDKNGENGPMPAAVPANRPLGDIMGVNGIRGWGHGYGSHDIGDTVQGAYLFSKVATYGRNYQNLSWDTHDPDHTPDYTGMPGSLRFGYVDWDAEYDIWNAAGLETQVSLQFLNYSQPENTWNNPWKAAYDIGYSFASHFGPTYGVGNVKTLEIGNEPWDYDKTFYRTVLNGMAQGAKAADPAMKVFSGALQAADPSREKGSSGNFIGERLTESEAPYLDGINSHHYSYMINPKTQKQIATYPENPLGGFRDIISDIRFRNHNMPGKEYHVTEWGWACDAVGMDCTLGECVTEKAQAIYAARGLFMMDRLGVDGAAWFFYADLPGPAGSSYSRSGLTGPVSQGSQKKLSFYVLEAIKDKLGKSYFIEAIQEDDNAWVYTYGDHLGNPEYVVAWRPISEADPSSLPVTVNLGLPVIAAFSLDGTPGGMPVSLPTTSGSQISFNVTATPVVYKLYNTAVVRKNSATNAAAFLDEPAVNIYPNPSNGLFQLDFQLDETSNVSISVVNMEGKIIHSHKAKVTAGEQSMDMQFNFLPMGTYILKINVKSLTSGSEKVKHQKLIIQN